MKKLLTILAMLPFSCVFGAGTNINYISVTELNKIAKENPSIAIVDIRTAKEYNNQHVKGSINIPAFDIVDGKLVEVTDFAEKIDSMYRDSDEKLYIMCKSSGRSKKAVATLLKNNWSADKFIVITGGMNAWNKNNLKIESINN